MDTPIHAVQATSALSSSLYFWWLAYLRCSKDYWWCCQQKGNCEDERLVNVYEQFGDVFKYRTLLDWWSDYGAHLFDSPQVEMDFVKYFPSGVEVLISQHPHTLSCSNIARNSFAVGFSDVTVVIVLSMIVNFRLLIITVNIFYVVSVDKIILKCRHSP
jgi:hypothetical protein